MPPTARLAVTSPLLVLALTLGGCRGGHASDQATTEECAAEARARRQLVGFVATARAAAQSAEATTSVSERAFHCDRMVADLYRLHGYVRGFNERWRVATSAVPNAAFVESALTTPDGAIDFMLEAGQCRDPDGQTTTRSVPTHGAPENERIRKNSVALRASLDAAEHEITASFRADCASR